jgi:hypothetical protein
MRYPVTAGRTFWILLCFALGALLRLVPEILLPGIPVGFDTVTYLAPTIHIWLRSGIGWTYAFQEGPLVYLLTYVPTLAGAQVFWVLKVLGPLLYGLFAVGVVVFVRENFALRWHYAFLGALFVILQVVNLRIGWDLWRNLLGLTLVLFVLAAWHYDRYLLPITAGLSVMTVLTNQFTAVMLFGTYAVTVGLGALKGRARTIALALLPAVVLFIVDLCAIWFINAPIGPNVIFLLRTRSQVINYVAEFGSAANFFDNYIDFGVFALSLLPLLALIGLYKEKILAGLCLTALIQAVWSPIFPTIGLPQWWRWVLNLGLPLSIYSFYAIVRIAELCSRLLGRIGRLASLRHPVQVALVVVLILPFGVQAIPYLSSPYSHPAKAFVNAQWNIYIPATMVGSSINPDDVPATLQAMHWLDVNAPRGSVVLVEERFVGWALLELRSDVHIIVYPVNSSMDEVLSASLLLAAGKSIFLIWLSSQEIHGFAQREVFGNIAVFQYKTCACVPDIVISNASQVHGSSLPPGP